MSETAVDPDGKKASIAAVAEALLRDYTAGGELTIFAVLDSEDFYASG